MSHSLVPDKTLDSRYVLRADPFSMRVPILDVGIPPASKQTYIDVNIHVPTCAICLPSHIILASEQVQPFLVLFRAYQTQSQRLSHRSASAGQSSILLVRLTC